MKKKHLHTYKQTELDYDLKKMGEKLADAFASLSKSKTETALKTIETAVLVRDFWDEAKRLDEGKNGIHSEHASGVLEKLIGSKSSSIRSRWVTIANQSPFLKQYASSLPMYRDALHQVAVEAKTNQERVKKLFQTGKIHAESSKREIEALRKGTTEEEKRRKQALKQYPAQITINVSSYEAAAKIVEAVLAKDTDFKVRSKKALFNEMKSHRESFPEFERRWVS